MDESTKKIIKEEIDKAEKRLKAAELLLKKDMIEDAANRIYYSVFYAAKAMLNSLGYDAKTHSGLISEFGLRIVKTRKTNKRLGVVLRKAFELRESADYHLAVSIDREETEELMEEAKNFLKEAKIFVSKNF